MSQPPVPSREAQHPRDSSFYSLRFINFWIIPLIKIAQKRQLKESDVWDMSQGMSVEDSHDVFEECWEAEKAKALKEGTEPSLFAAIVRNYWWGFLSGGLLQFSLMIFQLGRPFLVTLLVLYISNGERGLGYGLMLAFVLGLLSFCFSISIAMVFYVSRTLGIKLKAALTMAVNYQ
ncbi:hypothetical protein B484DRAFT_464173 [Ochromonadaceae sp. CCMP2298]|nr:hypothetical protein B484DRAFT_464173 [Ochromonadaceae sp. CCMP2298]